MEGATPGVFLVGEEDVDAGREFMARRDAWLDADLTPLYTDREDGDALPDLSGVEEGL